MVLSSQNEGIFDFLTQRFPMAIDKEFRLASLRRGRRSADEPMRLRPGCVVFLELSCGRSRPSSVRR